MNWNCVHKWPDVLLALQLTSEKLQLSSLDKGNRRLYREAQIAHSAGIGGEEEFMTLNGDYKPEHSISYKLWTVMHWTLQWS